MPRKPRPFQNPRIELGTHGRTWQTLSPTRLASGDIVAEKGQVTAVSLIQDPLGDEVVVTYLNGTTESYTDTSTPVLVFTKKVFDE